MGDILALSTEDVEEDGGADNVRAKDNLRRFLSARADFASAIAFADMSVQRVPVG